MTELGKCGAKSLPNHSRVELYPIALSDLWGWGSESIFPPFSQVQYESIILIKIMPQAQEIWGGRVLRSGATASI